MKDLTKMKLIGFYIALIYLVPIRVNAQNDFSLSDSYIAVSTSVGFPTAGRNSTSSTDWSGYETIGFNLNISADISIYHSFGIAAIIGYYKNKYDINTYMSNLDAINQSTHSQASARPYIQESLLAGLFKTFRVREKIWFDIRALAGYMITNYPNPNWTSSQMNDVSYNSININESDAFALDVGVGMRYLFRPRIYFLTGMDFLYSNPSYSGTEEMFDASGQSYQILSGKIDVSMLLLNIGVGYKLWE